MKYNDEWNATSMKEKKTFSKSKYVYHICDLETLLCIHVDNVLHEGPDLKRGVFYLFHGTYVSFQERTSSFFMCTWWLILFLSHKMATY